MANNKMIINIPVGANYEINLVNNAQFDAEAEIKPIAAKKKTRKKNDAIHADLALANFLIHKGFIKELHGVNPANESSMYFFDKTDAIEEAVVAYSEGLEQLAAINAVAPAAEDEFKEFDEDADS